MSSWKLNVDVVLSFVSKLGNFGWVLRDHLGRARFVGV